MRKQWSLAELFVVTTAIVFLVATVTGHAASMIAFGMGIAAIVAALGLPIVVVLFTSAAIWKRFATIVSRLKTFFERC